MKDNVVIDVVVGLLVLVWILTGICVVVEGVHALLVYVGLSSGTLVYSFVAITVLLIFLDFIMQRLLTRDE